MVRRCSYSFSVCGHCEKSVLSGSIQYAHDPKNFRFYHSNQLEIAENAIPLDEPIPYDLSSETKNEIATATNSIYGTSLNLTLFEGVRYTAVYILSNLGENEKQALTSCATSALTEVVTFANQLFRIFDVDYVSQEYFTSISLGILEIAPGVIDITFSIIGLLAAIRGLTDLIMTSPPALPVCGRCNQTDIANPGCVPFCGTCGTCDDGDIWVKGSLSRHCMKICPDCAKTCHDSDNNNENDEKHNDACETNKHGPLTTDLQNTYKTCLILANLFMIIGILLWNIPEAGECLRLVFMTGCIWINIGLRVFCTRNAEVTCGTCYTKGDINTFNFLDGCQKWSACCGRYDDEGDCSEETHYFVLNAVEAEYEA